MKIVLDPGHGQNYNAGAIKGYYEGNQMFKLAYYLKPELEKYGATVLVTRKKLSDDPALNARGQMAKGYDLFLSLHSNAPPSDAKDYNKISGTNVYDSVTRRNKALADKLGQAVAETMKHKYRGTVYRAQSNGKDYYSVLRNAVAVGCPSAMLIEHGFHTNPSDCRFLLDDINLQILAKIEAKVIAEHYGLIKGGAGMGLRYGVVLKKGAKGSQVKQLQEDLIKLGYGKYMEPWGADSSFGNATLKAVEAFQKANGLVVDGSVGPITQKKIAELLKAKPHIDEIAELKVEVAKLKNELEVKNQLLAKIREIVM